jgi:hypothetical protein
MKTMLIAFFDVKGVAHFEFIPQGQTVNQAYHMEILKRLRETAHRKMLELCPNDWTLYHYSAPAHKVLSVKQFLGQKSIPEVEHPPYSPDWLRMNFGCFQK